MEVRNGNRVSIRFVLLSFSGAVDWTAPGWPPSHIVEPGACRGTGAAVAYLVGRSGCRREQVSDGKELCSASSRHCEQGIAQKAKSAACDSDWLSVCGCSLRCSRGRHGGNEPESDCAVVVPAGRSIATLTPPKSFSSLRHATGFLCLFAPVDACPGLPPLSSTRSFCVAARRGV